jgi:hypothetical protein
MRGLFFPALGREVQNCFYFLFRHLKYFSALHRLIQGVRRTKMGALS